MTMALPATQAEFEDALNDPARMKDVWSTPGGWGEFCRGYAQASMGELSAQLKNEMQIGMADWLKGNPAPGNGTVTPAGMSGDMVADAARVRAANASLPMAKVIAKNKLFSKTALGAPLDSEKYSASIGTFLQAVWHKAEQAFPGDVEPLRNFRKTLRNALSERVPSEGGFLVPEVLRSQILMVALETAIVRPRARVIPMDSLRVPYPTIDDTSHTSSVFGGVIGYWTEEAAALTASAPSFGRIVLEAKKLTGYTTIPNELLQDSVAALDQWFNEMFPIALAWFEDVAFITGTGVGEPQGFLNSPCGIRVPCGTTHTVAFADIVAMWPRLLPASMNNAVWLCSPSVIGQLMQLYLNAGGSTPIAPPLWLNGMQAHDGLTMTLLGRPLIVSEKMPDSSSNNTTVPGALALVDFNYYLLGDRQSMQVQSSDEYLFANDLTAFRVIERLDGRAWLQSAITPENSGSTLSPIVFLDTTSTS